MRILRLLPIFAGINTEGSQYFALIRIMKVNLATFFNSKVLV